METIEDIVADIRAQNQGLPEDGYALSPLVSDLLGLADSIEKAYKLGNQSVTDCNQPVTDCHGLNAAKMREALKYLRDASREFCHLILNSKYNEVFDKYKYAEVSKIRDAIANANAALSASPRNCDLYLTKKERDAAYKKYQEYVILSSANPYVAQDEMMSKEEWLIAKAKGETK